MTETSLRDSLPATLSTERLTLRAPAPSDLEEIVRLLENETVVRWTASIPFPYGEADARHFIGTIAKSPDQRPYAIREDGGALVGVVGLMFEEGERPEIGYWLGEPHWGRGYAVEAAGAVIGAVGATGRVEGLCARALVENTRSLRVLEKLGFARGPDTSAVWREGETRAVAVFGLEFDR